MCKRRNTVQVCCPAGSYKPAKTRHYANRANKLLPQSTKSILCVWFEQPQ